MPEAATKAKTFRFDQMAMLINDRVDDPSTSGVDRYVGLEHLDADSLRIRKWGEITDVESTKLRFQPGDIVFGKRRVYQRKLAVADFEGICSAHAMVLRAKPDVMLPEFLPFFMQSDRFMERALEISVGSLSPTINWSSLAKEEFVVPRIEEQRRLTVTFRATDAAIEAVLRLEEAARHIWLAAVERVETANSSEIVSLGDLLEGIQAGRSVVGIDDGSAGKFAVLKVSAVDPLGFRPTESKVLIDQTTFQKESIVRAGDLLMTRSNTSELVGESCLVDSDYPNLMLCDKTLRLVPKPSVSVRLLWHMLQSLSVRQQILSVATGTGGAMKNISQPKIRGLSIAYPRHAASIPLEEASLDCCFKAFRAAQRRRSELGTLRQLLLSANQE